MGTSCALIVKRKNGTLSSVTVNYDGYVSYMKPLLLNHYNDIKKLETLISLGDLSVIAENVYPKTAEHSFAKHESNVCVFYGRDRGESIDVTKAIDYNEYDDFVFNHYYQEYNYIFVEETNTWFLIRVVKGNRYAPIYEPLINLS